MMYVADTWAVKSVQENSWMWQKLGCCDLLSHDRIEELPEFWNAPLL